MSLSAKDLDEIMQMFDRSRFNELKLEAGDLKLHLRKQGSAVAAEPVASSPPPAAEPVPAASTLPPLGPDEVDIPSPLLGVFYRAPKPGEPPFIEVGQPVEPDTVIGIIEVMKLMNSARAGVAGEVIAIHAANSEMVEYDQPLIRVRIAG